MDIRMDNDMLLVTGVHIEKLSRLKYPNFRVTMILIKQDPSIINDEDDCSNTPLHLAALHGHIKVVELLLNQGAAIDARYEG